MVGVMSFGICCCFSFLLLLENDALASGRSIVMVVEKYGQEAEVRKTEQSGDNSETEEAGERATEENGKRAALIHKNTGAPIFPRPKVFDVVRPLGAEQGEIEANILLSAPLRRRGGGFRLAPEIEWAFADGYAIEGELALRNGEVKAYKVALQGTLSHNERQTFIHGWQGIAEFNQEEEILESSLLYIAALDVGNSFSLFGMVGGRNSSTLGVEIERPHAQWHFLSNISINSMLTKNFVVSVETVYSHHFQVGNEFLVMPQVHYRFSHHLYLQAGIGYQWYLRDKGMPIVSSRIAYEF